MLFHFIEIISLYYFILFSFISLYDIFDIYLFIFFFFLPCKATFLVRNIFLRDWKL